MISQLKITTARCRYSQQRHKCLKKWLTYDCTIISINLFNRSQYGFRKIHSTELTGLELTDKILKDIDKKNASLAIFMDLNKAFDTLNHEILLNKLSHYSIIGTALKWFSSHLTGRQQYVKVESTSSCLLPLKKRSDPRVNFRSNVISDIYERTQQIISNLYCMQMTQVCSGQ